VLSTLCGRQHFLKMPGIGVDYGESTPHFTVYNRDRTLFCPYNLQTCFQTKSLIPMAKVHIFEVKPNIPDKLSRLNFLAYNLLWCWDHQIRDLFRRMDPDLWEEVYHNPIKLLGRISQRKYRELLKDDGFMDHYEQALASLNTYMTERSWFQKDYPEKSGFKTAYFSAEFGLHECLPIYSGGLGILAGDHLKSASDLGIPLIAVGLAYQKGYMQQYLNADGWQQETYIINEFSSTPMERVKDTEGKSMTVSVAFPGREVFIQCWKADVGRVPLYLLDTNLSENSPHDRIITNELYGGDLEKRIQQEIVLGIGGVKMLKLLQEKPTVYHMNEGHSAFLALERIRELMETYNLNFYEAKEAAVIGNVFTTHTSVPAGNDIFPRYYIDRYFKDYAAALGLNPDEFMSLGRIALSNGEEGFCMTVLAMKLSSRMNAVSHLHREVSRKMWQNLWPETPANEIPLDYVTNGVHPPSWISREMHNLLTRYLGPQWMENPHDVELWQRVDKISDEELWRMHERGRERLVAFARERLKRQLIARGSSSVEILEAEDVLNPEYLTIGFARRFATYKRATLLLHNPERLKKIITNNDMPVQFIFAGKAHPKDEPGKEFIRALIHFMRDENIRHRMVFIENFDICVARQMVQGVDVWLNTPRRGLEASGTSGMKAAFNGALNLSILDGWWDEGFKPNLGWAIGKGEQYDDHKLQDEVESNALYDILEQDLIPLFYRVSPNGIPREWVKYMKESMKELCPEYSTNRMTFNYTVKYYLSSHFDFSSMNRNDFALAKECAKWKQKLRESWSRVKVLEVNGDDGNGHKVDDDYLVRVKVQLGDLTPEDVSVEIYCGPVNESRVIDDGAPIKLEFLEGDGSGASIFTGKIPLKASGLFGYSARVRPCYEKYSAAQESAWLTWEW